MTTTRLLTPTLAHLAAFRDALQRGWSPNTTRPEAAGEMLAASATDAEAFVAGLTDPSARAGPVTLPDGSRVPRLPGLAFWIVDGDDTFCGSLGLRWQNGTPALPPHVLGHVGYTVVPWQQRRGHASAALRGVLPHARAVGLPHIELTTDPDNLASQKVIERAGGVLVERFTQPPAFGSKPGLRYRIAL